MDTNEPRLSQLVPPRSWVTHNGHLVWHSGLMLSPSMLTCALYIESQSDGAGESAKPVRSGGLRAVLEVRDQPNELIGTLRSSALGGAVHGGIQGTFCGARMTLEPEAPYTFNITDDVFGIEYSEMFWGPE